MTTIDEKNPELLLRQREDQNDNEPNESEIESRGLLRRNIDELKSGELWRACFAEMVGVFLLGFFTIGVGVSKDGDPPAPLLQSALGVAFFITIAITSLSTVSGGHVNPAISIGFLITNKISIVRFVFYSVFQVIGGIAGVATLKAILPPEYRGAMGLIQPGAGVPLELAVGMEVMITGLLLFVTIACIDSHREDVQGSIPYMVGLTVCVNILTAGKISGGCMNPARASGSAAVVGNTNALWVYWIGPMLGAVLGAWIYDSFFSTRPLHIIANAIDKNKKRPSSSSSSNNNIRKARKTLSSAVDPQEAEMIEATEHTKLSTA